jgi:hypothetical protein
MPALHNPRSAATTSTIELTPVRQHQALLIYGRRFQDDFAISENGFVAVSPRDAAGALRGGSMCEGSQVVPSEADPGMASAAETCWLRAPSAGAVRQGHLDR